jgi:hypothetical protein
LTIDVVGPGFGRTGTTSGKAALELLGFGPCYHMQEVYERAHIEAWEAVIAGAPLDCDRMFAGFRSTLDWPACSYWKEIKRANPMAKVLLTRRDPDAWFDSIEQTIFPALRAEHPDPLRTRWRASTRKLIFEETFGNRFDRAHVIGVLRAHEQDVIASVSRDELLVFDVADGWVPLCAFLGVDVPGVPFPHTNSTAEFREETGLDR